MSKLVPPHGGKGLTECLLKGAELEAEKKKAQGLKKITLAPPADRIPLSYSAGRLVLPG